MERFHTDGFDPPGTNAHTYMEKVQERSVRTKLSYRLEGLELWLMKLYLGNPIKDSGTHAHRDNLKANTEVKIVACAKEIPKRISLFFLPCFSGSQAADKHAKCIQGVAMRKEW